MSQDTTHRVHGLRANAEIRVDRWGVAHIRAECRQDLFFAQGFNIARDRLWQIDLWRKRGLGLLSEDFGPGYLAQDRAARLFLYRGDMAAEWQAYGVKDLHLIVERFVSGINSYIALCELDPDLLPIEFSAMKTRPHRWKPEDVVRIRSHALASNLQSEAMRAQVLAKSNLLVDQVRRSIDPPHEVVMPTGLDVAAIAPDVLEIFQLATAPVNFTAERLAAKLVDAGKWNKVSDLGDVFSSSPNDGSNNWVVSPQRTKSGRPVLATDPHRAYWLPSIRYVVHLTSPDLDVIGAGEPCLPGISFGHNGSSAFAMTVFPADQEDLYIYETNNSDPSLYRYADGYEHFTVVRETIQVRGHGEHEIELAFSRHGPVIHVDTAKHVAIAARTVWTLPGTAPYLGSLALLDAKTISEFESAAQSWGSPCGNYVYADKTGDIGWFVVGKIPRRPNWDGLLPVPGDGTYEWDGYLALADLPKTINPTSGFFATANEMNLPADYPAEDRKLGFEFQDTARARRIKEVLDADPYHSVEAACKLQTDDVSDPARRIIRLLPEITSARGADMLRGWDSRIEENSASATLFEVWWTLHLKPALLAMAAPDQAIRELLGAGDHETLLTALEHPDRFAWIATASQRDALLLDTIEAAWSDCASRLGEDSAAWAWGRLHHGYFSHPLSATLGSGSFVRDVGPLPLGGSGSTPMATHYRNSDFRATGGASFRAVFDVGAWDASRFVNAPGQSGNSWSAHFDNLASLWASRQYCPLLYSTNLVDEATETVIRLLAS